MVSPFMTVAILTVLWLIVVVPMIVHRGDKAARTRAAIPHRTRGRARPGGFARSGLAPSMASAAWLQARAPLVAHAARGPVLAAEEATM